LLEDQLHDARAAADAHEQAYTARMARFRESEVQLRKDLETAAVEKNALTSAEAAAIARIQEISTALQESDTALEDARAEIELLRSDMAVLKARLVVRKELNATSVGLRSCERPRWSTGVCSCGPIAGPTGRRTTATGRSHIRQS